MWTPEALALVAVTFALAGLVKGLVGFGLPVVALALLATTIGLQETIAVLIVPSLITNIWQSLVGGNFIMLMKRMWLFYLCAIAGIWLGVIILASQDTVQLVAVLGGLLIAYSAISLTGFQIPAPGRREPWIAPIIGGLAGIAYGCTGSFVMPGTIFVQALRMPRDTLIQALGITYTIITVILAVFMSQRNLLPMETGLVSVGALVPAAAGMYMGQRLRHHLPEARFRKAFFSALFCVGCYMVIRVALS